MRRRVVVTGIGAISGAGPDSLSFRDTLKQGRACFRELDPKRTKNWKATHAALVPDEWLKKTSADPLFSKMDRIVHLSLTAMRESLRNSGLDIPVGEAAVVLGTCSGGMLSIERHYRALAEHRDPLDPILLFSKKYYTPAKVLACMAGANGPVLTVVTACAAGAGAIAQGADLIRTGMVDIALTGGADTFAYSTLVGFDALKATCEGVCTPFSKNIGLNLGEGSGFLVLEELSHATKRKATILAEISGTGLSNDAYHPTSPDPSTKGQVSAMKRALCDAGLDASQLEYINAHGTGTRANDPIECRAIGKVVGSREVPTSSTKSMIGHCLGAAGALESAATVLALREGFLPATSGFTEPRDGCHLPDFVADAGRPFSGHISMTNSFGFGGNNACVVIDTNPEGESQSPVTKASKPVITGMGVVHSLGIGLQRLTGSEVTGLKTPDRFSLDTEIRAGLVPNINPREVDRRLDVRGMDLCSLYATYASRLALENAGHSLRPTVTKNIGMVLGLATGPTMGETTHLETCFKDADHIGRLDAFPYVVQNEVAGHVARSLMLRGHNTVLSNGWGAGLAALISGVVTLEQGHAEILIAAASDELTERTLEDGLKVALWGPGTELTPGEGAVAFVVEQNDVAISRGVSPIAEILGYSITCDTSHPMWASGHAIKRAIDQAVSHARINPEAVVRVAVSLDVRQEGRWETTAARNCFTNAELVCLHHRVGFPEASLSLLNLAHVFATSEKDDLVVATSLSQEGIANVVVMRIL